MNEADRQLQSAVDRLHNLLDKSAGWSNGIKRQIAEQIVKLIKKWD